MYTVVSEPLLFRSTRFLTLETIQNTSKWYNTVNYNLKILIIKSTRTDSDLSILTK